jgi:hypothetical protein
MPISYSYESGRGQIRTIVVGDIALAEIDAHLKSVTVEPWYPAPAIVDVRLASVSLPSRDVRLIVELLREIAPRTRSTPIAVVVGSDVAFGLVRMIQLLLDDVVNIRPFRTEEAATGWLKQESEPSAGQTA